MTVTSVIDSYYSSRHVGTRVITVAVKAAASSAADGERRAGACRSVLTRFVFQMQAVLAAVLICVSYSLYVQHAIPVQELHVDIDMRNGRHLL